MRKFYLLLLFLPFLLPVSSMAQNQIPDTVYVFRFVSHKDMFYVPWKDNETQLIIFWLWLKPTKLPFLVVKSLY